MKCIKVFLLAAFLFFSCSEEKEEKVVIAVAANMQYAMQSLTEVFTLKTGIPCETIIASSGKLTAQIHAGAPYDIFVSADLKYPQFLFESSLSSQPKVYAKGKLVLWTMNKNIELGIDYLETKKVTHVAIANPKTSPYGRATIEVLNHYQLVDRLSDTFVFGESIAQTNQYVFSKAAEVGFTAMSVVMAPQNRKKGKWIAIDNSLYEPIAQGIVMINKKGESTITKQFYDFMFSDEAKEILVNFGYEIE